MLGHLPDDGGVDSECHINPGLCSANAACIPVATTNRCSCKHDQAMVCYPQGILWGKKFCWHGTSNCRKDQSTEVSMGRQDDICGSGSCPAGTPCKHNRAPNCYPFQFRNPNKCFHGTTYCPPGSEA